MHAIRCQLQAFADFVHCSLCSSQPCYNDVVDPPSGGYGEDEFSQADWGASLSSILTAHSSASGKGSVAGGTINSFVDETWRASSGVGGCSSPIPYPLPGFDASQCSWKAHVQCPSLNLWHHSLCGFWTPATFDQYTNVAWFGMLRPAPQAGDVDRLTPRLLYGKLQEQWSGVGSNWAWIGLMVLTLAVAAAATFHTRNQFQKRRQQVLELETRAASASLSGRSPLGVISPSPAATTSSPADPSRSARAVERRARHPARPPRPTAVRTCRRY
jgi:hypothetical protein